MNNIQQDRERFNFIVQCCIFSLKGKVEKTHDIENNINKEFSKLYDVAQQNKVLPVFFDFFTKHPNILSEEYQNVIKKEYKENTFDNLLKTKELLSLYKQFDNQGVKIIPYKGVVFTQEIYGSISLRSFSDIDFWYKKKDTSTIKTILNKNGYKSVLEYSKIQEYFFNKINCEYHFVKFINGKRILIEPHYWLTNHFIQVNPSEKLLNQNRLFKISNQQISIFSIEMTFIYLVSHHGTTKNWSLIKHHLDVAMFIRKFYDINWDKLLELCDAFELKQVALVGILNAKKLFNLDLPLSLSKACNEKHINQLSNLSLKNSFTVQGKWYSTFYKIYFLIRTKKGLARKSSLVLSIVEYSLYRFIFECLMFFQRKK